MKNITCKWTFKYVDRGIRYYTSECGQPNVHKHVYYRYCPYCGNEISLSNKEDDIKNKSKGKKNE